MPQIFISYAREDGSEIADEIADRLRSLQHEVFLDVDSIRVGSVWKKELKRRVHWANVLIVIITPASNESDFVYQEIELAKLKKKTILPIQVNNTPLPVYLRGTWHATKLRDGNYDSVLLEL